MSLEVLRESPYSDIHIEIKEIAILRMKTALVDRKAMFTDLTLEEANVIASRCEYLFKYLISLDADTASEWFQAAIAIPAINDNVKPQDFVSIAEYVFERFQEEHDLNFRAEFGLHESEVIGAIMCHIWQTQNVAETDFTFFCDFLRLDESTYNMVKKALHTKNDDHHVMSKKLQESMTSGIDLYVLLTMANAEASKWPFKINWKEVEIDENELTVEHLNVFDEMLKNHAKEILENSEESTIRDCGEVVQQLQQTVKDVNAKFDDAYSTIKKLSDTDLIEMIEEHVSVVAERRNIIKQHIPASVLEHKNYSDTEVAAAYKQLNANREDTAFISNPSSTVSISQQTFSQRLELQRGQTCLARRKNSHFFVPAKIVNKQTASRFTVEFFDNGSFSSLDISDIANTEVPLWDNSLGNSLNRFIGMRVAAYVEQKGKGFRWMAGTVGATFGSHGDDFLVFFDRHIDRYITPIFQSTCVAAREYREMENCKPHGNLELLSWMKARTEFIRMFPLCEQAFNVGGTEVCRTVVYELVNDSDQIRTFLHRYFNKFPDWPLVRMRKPLPDMLPQRLLMADKKIAFVVEVDRAMCVVRYPRYDEPGDDCFLYNCNLGHNHDDEWIYRGSSLINTVNMDKTDNTNLSKRQKNRNQSYYDEETTKKHTARKSGIPSNNYNACVPTDNLISKEELSEKKKKANTFKIASIEYNAPHIVYKTHVCTKECLRNLEISPYDLRFKNISPLAIPLMCGWNRTKYQITHGRTRSSVCKYIMYTSPCGLSLKSLHEIGKYLRECDSQLTIDLFSDNLVVDPLKFIEVDKSAIIVADYSQGQECFPIPAVNTLDKEFPPKIQYGARKFPFDERVNISTISKHFCSGCSCEDDCSDASKCECQKLTADTVIRLANSFRPKEFGYKYRQLHGRTISGVFECNQNCGCNNKKCWNRVVQNEIKYPLQLFKTAGCGWGARTVCDIPKGAFIANYVGALMTDEIAEIKGKNDDQYFADLDLNDVVENEKLLAQQRFGHLDFGSSEADDESVQFVPEIDNESENDEVVPPKKLKTKRESQNEMDDRKKIDRSKLKQREMAVEEKVFKWSDYFGETEQLFVLDAKYKGNIGRFLNHSCDPNVYVQQVLVDTHDLRLPWSSFFASRDINAGEELCWNYGYHIDDERPPELQVKCHCGSKYCCSRLL